MAGPDEEHLAFEDLVDSELGEITEPEATRSTTPELAIGSDIHAVPPDGVVNNRAPLDGIDAVLVAYLLDMDESPASSADPVLSDDSPPTHIEPEVTKPERPRRR